MKIEKEKIFSAELLQAIRNLIPQLTDSVGLISEETVKEILNTENTHLFVARTDDNRIVGILTLAVFTIPTSKKAYIEDVVVDGTVQGQGLGRRMLKAAISFAKEQNVSRIELSSNPSRIAANKLYKSLGFEVRNTNFYRLQL